MSHKHKNPFNKNSEELDIKAEEHEETPSDTEPAAQAEDTTKPAADNELQEKYDRLNQQYIRLAADFDNYRKRQEQEREALLKYGAENALKKMIEVLDNFERGEKALENVDDCQQVKDSFNLLHKQVMDTLTKLGLEPIETAGQEFDPNFHEAVMQTPTSEHPENTIINELQKGYKMGDKVLRASLVNVATAE